MKRRIFWKIAIGFLAAPKICENLAVSKFVNNHNSKVHIPIVDGILTKQKFYTAIRECEFWNV